MSLTDDITAQRAIVERERRKLLQLLTTAVILRDGTQCAYCGVPTLLTAQGHPQRRTLDHVIPQKFGGSDDLDNLKIACSGCNSRKGAQVSQRLLCPSCRGQQVTP